LRQSSQARVAPLGAVRLSDGRSVTFISAGPADGFPVVYCHGAIGSPRWRTPGLDEVIGRFGIRYLVVNRPGFGGSDPSPGRSVVDFACDLGEVMSALGYRRFSIVGVSAGGPYALACGWALAERIVALAAVSPLGPVSGRRAREDFRYRLPLVPFGPPHGHAVAHVCLRAARMHRQTPARAMVEDYRVCRRYWGFEPADVRVPVTLWHGRADRLVPLSHTLELAAAVPNSTALVDQCGGHFFYSRRLADIVGTLVPVERRGAFEAPALVQAA
jgi:pimeloyl-ACP methyl ester carboxylesterase